MEAPMKVKDIMSKSVDYIDPKMSLKEAATRMRDDDVGVLPVAENDRLVGMLTDRDIVIHALANGKADATAGDAMTKKVLYVFEDDSLENLAETLGKNQVHRMPVLNKDKKLAGIVSLGDLACKGSEKLGGQALCKISQPGACTPGTC